jgi:hypothetical protein
VQEQDDGVRHRRITGRAERGGIRRIGNGNVDDRHRPQGGGGQGDDRVVRSGVRPGVRLVVTEGVPDLHPPAVVRAGDVGSADQRLHEHPTAVVDGREHGDPQGLVEPVGQLIQTSLGRAAAVGVARRPDQLPDLPGQARRLIDGGEHRAAALGDGPGRGGRLLDACRIARLSVDGPGIDHPGHGGLDRGGLGCTWPGRR